MSLKTENKDGWRHIGVIGVDAGLVSIGDPCYYKEKSIADMRNAWEAGFDESREFFKKEEWQELVIKHRFNGAAASKDVLDEALAAITVSSGYGDGCYNVFAKFKDGRISAVLVEFFDEEVNGETSLSEFLLNTDI